MLDFRAFVEQLDAQGKLTRITREVDPRFELPGIMQLLDQRDQAYLFENVKGSSVPVIGGVLNDPARYAMLFGHEGEGEFSKDDFRVYLDQAEARAVPPVRVETGPVKEVVESGDQVRLTDLPVPTYFELDTGPFITAGVGIARDPETGIQNMGTYRTLILNDRECVISASLMNDLHKIYMKYKASGEPMPIALVLGVQPAVQISAPAKTPLGHSELDLAGGFQGEPIELVQCETSDLLVPANAEMVIEGTVDFSRSIDNNHGEFHDLYGEASGPVTRVDAITHRKDYMFYALLGGRSKEHNGLGTISVYGIKDALAAAVAATVPEAKKVAVHFNPLRGALCHIGIAIDKESDEQPGDIIQRVFAADAGPFPISMLTRRVVVVDTDVNVDDWDDVEWAIWTRVADDNRYILIPKVVSWEVDRAADDEHRSLRMGVDATMAFDRRKELVRPQIEGVENLKLEDYL